MGKVKSMMMDQEEKMFDVIEEAIRTVDHLTEVMQIAIKEKHLVPHWTDQEIEDACSEYWEEYWASKI